MLVIQVRNVHEALPQGIDLLLKHGVREDSRNGPVLRFPTPVSTVCERPWERVETHPWRDSNPFLHFYEMLWMLAGRHDVESMTRYARRFKDFSDDGVTFNAAYGWRWRVDRGDQLRAICQKLRANPGDRRVVLSISDPARDLWSVSDRDEDDQLYVGKDAACNVAATFQTDHDGRLCLVVFCRSNDLIWGCYGANAVHFSALLEYVATMSGLPMGTYTQVSVNLHAYTRILDPMLERRQEWAGSSYAGPYSYPGDSQHASGEWQELIDRDQPNLNGTLEHQEQWDAEVRRFTALAGMSVPIGDGYRDDFFNSVATPIVAAHDYYKLGDFAKARDVVGYCEAPDWQMACLAWLARRELRLNQREGVAP